MPEDFLAAIFGVGAAALGCGLCLMGKSFFLIAGGLIVFSVLGFIL